MIDSHCHIHDDDFPLNADDVLADSLRAGLEGVICVGTNARYSEQAVAFAKRHQGTAWASVGLHPHEAAKTGELKVIEELAKDNSVIAVGECGLDYYYANSSPKAQKTALVRQFEIAHAAHLPMIFHIRGSEPDSADAYDDFWPIYDRFKPRGVIHSFSAYPQQAEQIIERGLFFGVNGIATFTKNAEQTAAYRHIPLENLLIETDAPYLTPAPHRGTINVPKQTLTIAKFLAGLMSVGEREIVQRASSNARQLFSL